MRQVSRKGLITVVAAGGALALSGGVAHADASAEGGSYGSPGVASGNTVQVPVHVPVNACGNTVNVVGALNPSMGNKCVNNGGAHAGHDGKDGGHHGHDGGGHHGHEGGGHQGGSHQDGGHQGGGAQADGAAVGSPGVVSGNTAQVPVQAPVNVCGNTVDVVGVLNPAMGNECVNGHAPEGPAEEKPEPPQEEKPEAPAEEKPEAPEEEKPEKPGPSAPEAPGTGDDGGQPKQPGTGPAPQLAETGGPALTTAFPVGAGMLLGGYVLYRRARAARL
ncbi:chaplin [Streptomyces sp. TRM 70351]|uniref:chaplin n=1 Tax=Streptomyces sp. TRM 70351 TaxID=3116552 RepID=UPI002E7B941D|nr:chaplin [Streptomyces sp. TRM 70351]MEE1929203.1 chaplin [Streptomyces sp. TRM 70351]